MSTERISLDIISNDTFQDAQDRLNYLEKKEEWCNKCHAQGDCDCMSEFLESVDEGCPYYS